MFAAAAEIPKGVIQKGTLANQKLIYDTKFAVAAQFVRQGCTKPETLQMYIRKMPSGKVGSRVWSETWVIGGCNTIYPVKLDFMETSTGVLYHTVK